MSGIEACINLGLEVELDVRMIDEEFWLGHDKPIEKISWHQLMEAAPRAWFHCKNLDALKHLGAVCGVKAFWHEKDQFTMIDSYIFTRPGEELTENSIAVMPEMADYTLEELSRCHAICTDKYRYFKEMIDGRQ